MRMPLWTSAERRHGLLILKAEIWGGVLCSPPATCRYCQWYSELELNRDHTLHQLTHYGRLTDYNYDSPLPAHYDLLIDTAGRALHYPTIDDDNVSSPDSVSSASSLSITSHVAFSPATHEYVPHHSAEKNIGLGIYEADGTLLEMGIVGSPANIESQTTEPALPISGSDAPYWGTYAVRAVREEEFIRKEIEVCCTAFSSCASSKIRAGDFPPSSSVTAFKFDLDDASITFLPAADEPVKAIFCTSM